MLVVSCLDGPRFLLLPGDGDLRTSVHFGSIGYEALGEGLQGHLGIYDEHEREEEALCERRYWEIVEEGWFSE